jgi:hypothetical protein
MRGAISNAAATNLASLDINVEGRDARYANHGPAEVPFSFVLIEGETGFSRACIRAAINSTLIRHQSVNYHASGNGLGRWDAQSGLSRAIPNLN